MFLLYLKTHFKSIQVFLGQLCWNCINETCWLKISFGTNVLGFSHHAFLEGDTQSQEQLIKQSLGESIPLARGRASTLVSEPWVLCTTLPLEARRHLLRSWQGCYSVSSPACVSCCRVLVWCCSFLSTRSCHSLWRHGSYSFLCDPSPHPHPLALASSFTVLAEFPSSCQFAAIDN